ncbi:AhpA/YtjB family protein [Thalassotalea aquiviva]|uniref:AhpA/YtjB family protein n=1 Tax=Thalassotalea aquiviva TaxID=3242415 RepID=UPI00352ABD21
MTKKENYQLIKSPLTKLFQVGGGVILLLLMLNVSLMNINSGEKTIEQHFDKIGKSIIVQAVNSSKVFLELDDKSQLSKFMQSLAESDAVLEAILYDAQGQVVAHSQGFRVIKELYGIEEGSINRAANDITIIEEIRTEELQGYLRLNLARDHFVDDLHQQLDRQSELMRIILIAAITTGFLLTRGFSRLSRQGTRFVKRK